jgi:hypothetical protein
MSPSSDFSKAMRDAFHNDVREASGCARKSIQTERTEVRALACISKGLFPLLLRAL